MFTGYRSGLADDLVLRYDRLVGGQQSEDHILGDVEVEIAGGCLRFNLAEVLSERSRCVMQDVERVRL